MPRHIDVGMTEHLGNIVDRGTAGIVKVANVWRAT